MLDTFLKCVVCFSYLVLKQPYFFVKAVFYEEILFLHFGLIFNKISKKPSVYCPTYG